MRGYDSLPLYVLTKEQKCLCTPYRISKVSGHPNVDQVDMHFWLGSDDLHESQSNKTDSVYRFLSAGLSSGTNVKTGLINSSKNQLIDKMYLLSCLGHSQSDIDVRYRPDITQKII